MGITIYNNHANIFQIRFRYDIEITLFNTERILPHDEVVSTKGK